MNTADSQPRNDLLSLLMEIETDEKQLVADMIVFLVAGNHTTAMTLGWVLYFLTQY